MPKAPLSIGFDLPFNEAIAAMEARGVVLPEKYYGELQGIHRQLNFSIAGVASLDQLQGVLDSLSAKLADGQSFKQWQDSVSVQDLGLPKHRMDNIYRTNIQNAYNRGHWEQFKENEKFAPYLMYDSINDSRTRPSHRAMDGIIRLVSDPFWDTHYPANGYRCRCSVVSLSEKQAQARSKGGNGLNKSIDVEKMKPDKGWDYNCGEDITTGIDKAVADRKANPDIEPKLKALIDDKAMLKPDSKPVSDAFKTPKSGFAKHPSELILSIIDSIHSDGVLPEIPIKSTASRSFYGAYTHTISSKDAVKIDISSHGDHPELTLAHEIGHFIDHQAFGEKGFSSLKDDMFAEWRDAVSKSNATKEIKDIGGKMSSYYLSTHEQWARSYAQYIATKSGNEKLLHQLDSIRNGANVSPIRKSSQWQDNDFEKISKSIDNLFSKVGWIL